MLHFTTNSFSGTSVQYSPFLDNRILLGASANFGIVGNGKLFALEIGHTGQINVVSSYDTQDSVFCACWSESHENQLVAGCGDGSIQLFDCARPQFPLTVLKEHQKEVFGLSWNLIDKNLYCSSSWDGTVKVWSTSGIQHSLNTLNCSQSIVYQAKYSPHSPDLIATAQQNGLISIFDTRAGVQPVQSLKNPAGSGECLTVDWNKYLQGTLASGGSDGVVRVYDIRSSSFVNELRGHKLAVKSVKWSPHSPKHILSASYDMSAKVWVDDRERTANLFKGPVNEFRKHTEFVTDCDWSLWGQPGWVATTSFDTNLYIWNALR